MANEKPKVKPEPKNETHALDGRKAPRHEDRFKEPQRVNGRFRKTAPK